MFRGYRVTHIAIRNWLAEAQTLTAKLEEAKRETAIRETAYQETANLGPKQGNVMLT